MLQHLDKQKQCVQAVLSERSVVNTIKEESLSLTAAQWNRIASMLPVLEGLQIATTAMSSEQNVSASCILPVVNGLKNNFLKIIQTDGTLLKSFKQTVSADLSKIFHMGLDADSISAVAACFDPRHKSLKFLNETLRLRIHEHVRSLVDDVEERSKINTDTEAELPKNICNGFASWRR